MAVIGFFILMLAVMFYFSWIRGDLGRAFRLSVSDFDHAAFHLNKHPVGEGGYRVNKDKLFQAVGRPTSSVEIGGEDYWFWECSDGQVQISVSNFSDDIVFEIVSKARH